MYDHQYINYQQQQQYNMQYQQFNQFPQQMMPRLQVSQSQEVLGQPFVRSPNGNMQPQMPMNQNYPQNHPNANFEEQNNDEIKITQEVKAEEINQAEPEVIVKKTEKVEHVQTPPPVLEKTSPDHEQNKHDEKPIMTIENKEEIKHKHNSSFNAEDIPIKTNKLSFEELLAQNLKNEGGIEDDVFRRPVKPAQTDQKSSFVQESKDKNSKKGVEHSPQRNSEDKGSYLISKFVILNLNFLGNSARVLNALIKQVLLSKSRMRNHQSKVNRRKITKLC